MQFRCHPLGPEVAVAFLAYPIESATDIYRAWRDWQATKPNEVSSQIILWTIPEGFPLPGLVPGQEVLAVSAVYAGSVTDGRKEFLSLRGIGTPLVNLSDIPWSYRVIQSGFDSVFAPKGQLYAYFKSLYIEDLNDDAIDLIVKRGGERPNSMTLLNLLQMGGAISDIAADETAFSARNSPFMFSIDGFATDAHEADRFIPWIRDFWDEMQRFAVGGPYLNFLGEEQEGQDRLVNAAYGANFGRLAGVKKRYDPDNFFRVNQNIRPED